MVLINIILICFIVLSLIGILQALFGRRRLNSVYSEQEIPNVRPNIQDPLPDIPCDGDMCFNKNIIANAITGTNNFDAGCGSIMCPSSSLAPYY